MTREARQVRCPEAVLGWIPWYSEGCLTDEQMGTVESHASECEECRAELDMVSGAPFEVDFELPDPELMFAEITRRIEAREAVEAGGSVIPIDRARVLSVDDLEAIEDWVLDPAAESVADEALTLEEEAGFAPGLFPEFANGQSPTAIGSVAQRESVAENVVEGPWARKAIYAAAAALALFMMGGVSGALLSGSTQADSHQASNSLGDYSLASAGPANSVGGPQIDVVFENAASAIEISTALRADGLEIVSGPSSLGVYRLVLTQTAANGSAPSAADAAEIAARLSAPGSTIATFAEPVP